MKKSLLAVIAFCAVSQAHAQQTNFPFWDDPAIGGCALQSAMVKQTAKAREDGVSMNEMVKISKELATKMGKESAWILDMQLNVLKWVYAHEMLNADNVTIDFTRQCLRAEKPAVQKIM